MHADTSTAATATAAATAPTVSAVAATRPPPPSVVLYYRETTQDYRAWSPNLNMHFGYWRRGLSPFDRERMIDEMTLQVLARLERGGHQLARLADLGCGAGGPAAVVLRARPGLRLDGVTLLPEQVALARAAAARHGVGARAVFHAADYTAAPLPAGAFDGAMAIESACHAPGADKLGFVREAARLLAPGGRLVVADGFLKPPVRRAGLVAPRRRRGVRLLSFQVAALTRFARERLGAWAIDALARNWAVPGFARIDAFRRALADHGFDDIETEEVSMRLGPSVLHIPFVTARVLARYAVRRDRRIGRVRWGHVLASVLAPIVGLMRRRFGYFFVVARKRR